MDKKNAPTISQSESTFTTNCTTAAEVYTLLSGSLVTVDHPGDLIPIGRFLSLYEAGIDDGRLSESLQSVRDLLTFGRIKVKAVVK
jgi:hypothetical protein